MKAIYKYRWQTRFLFLVRKFGFSEKWKDRLLDRMDVTWWELSSSERHKINLVNKPNPVPVKLKDPSWGNWLIASSVILSVIALTVIYFWV